MFPPPNTRCDTVPSSSRNEDIPHPRTRPSPPRSPPSPELVTHSTSQEKDPDECFMNPQRPRGVSPPPPNTRCDTVPSSSSNEDIPHPRTRPSPPRSPPSPELVTHSTSQEKDPDECFMNPQRPRGGVPPPPPPPHGLTPSRDHHASRTYPTRGPDPVHLAALRRPIWIPTVSARRSPLGLQISIGPPTNTRPQRSFCSHTRPQRSVRSLRIPLSLTTIPRTRTQLPS